jgi:hypothetical protein
MAMTEREERELEGLFAAARERRPELPDDLMARILADAQVVAAEREAPRPVPARGRWRAWLAELGGWPVVGGLVASTVAGLWIGAAQPLGLSDLLSSLGGEQVSVGLGLDEDPLSLLEG